MTHEYELVEQNILLYEARLKHIDELYSQIEKVLHQKPQMEISMQLNPIKSERERLAAFIEETGQEKKWQFDHALITSDPSGPWNLVAQELDRLLILAKKSKEEND